METTSRRTALVTGANRGIGLAIAHALSGAGMQVWLACRAADSAESAAANVGRGAVAVALDLDDLEAVDDFARRDGRRFDVLINNAGVLHDRPLLRHPDDLAEALRVMVEAPLRLAAGIIPAMVERRHGRIVNLSSGWGAFSEGLGGPNAYGIAKAALNALTIRLDAETPDTVRVNAMDPGWVHTRMGGPNAPRSPQEAADTALWLATLGPEGPSGGFFRDRRRIDW